MASKKMTLMDNYEVVKAMLNGTYKGAVTKEQAVAFIDNRMEQVAKKNASKGSGEPTKADLAKRAANAELENAVIVAMVQGTKYTATDLVKKIAEVESTQKLTPRLTALVEANRLVKTEEKGRSYYSLPTAE